MEKLFKNLIRMIVTITLHLWLAFNASSQVLSLGLPQLLEMAESNYPLLKSKALEVKAARENNEIVKNSLIPSLDAAYQVNYATANNITGMISSPYLVPISGPPSTTNRFGGVFGSAVSVLMNWQPVNFGYRKAQSQAAIAGLGEAEADANLEIFQHKVAVVRAWLQVHAARELVNVYEKDLVRREAILQSIRSLVISGIRPGVDTALWIAEIATARILWLQSQNQLAQSMILLRKLVAAEDDLVLSQTSFFLILPGSEIINTQADHPLTQLQRSRIGLQLARKEVLSKSTRPALGVWSTVFARGSGISHDGNFDAVGGLGLQRFNFGFGLQLSVPMLLRERIKPQLNQQEYLVQAGIERLNLVGHQLKFENEAANSSYDNAISVARESPKALDAAHYAYGAFESRYKSGLATLPEILQSQYSLVRAETDMKLAYLKVWEALLIRASVNGDLGLFLNQLK